MSVYYLRIDYYVFYCEVEIYLFLVIHTLYEINTTDRGVDRKEILLYFSLPGNTDFS